MTQQLELDTERPTQKRRVLAALRAAGYKGICVASVPLDLGYTLRNRIGELRRDGYAIEGHRCTFHLHQSTMLRYVLREEP